MKKILLCLMTSLFPLLSYSQVEEGKMVKSLIVALDVRSKVNKSNDVHYEKDWNPIPISDELGKILDKNNIKIDFASGVLYGIKEGDLKPDNFSRLIVSPQEVSNNYLDILQNLHSNLPYGTYYSITSFAKPYSLMALKDKKSTNMTYMAIITDGVYNGNDDYYGEASYVKKDFSDEGKKQFQNDIANVQTNYFCRFIDQHSIRGGHIQLYEFIPLQQYFSLESVVDFPHQVIAKRTKQGYEVKFILGAINNKDYETKKLLVSLQTADGTKSEREVNFNQEITFNISKSEIDGSQIGIRAWVKLIDGVYNNTVLHPEGSKLQGAEGLSRTIVIEKENNATILGIMPLPDFLFSLSFWTSSQFTAANTWGWILIFILVALIVYAIRKSNIYKPNPKEIKI